jgi:UDP-glucuronate 4-epimerase
MWRDFSYIDDIVSGTLAALERPAGGDAPHKIYNLGNDRSEKLTDFIEALEDALGLKAEMKFEPPPRGDVVRTHADIESSRRELGFDPATPISEGVPKFVRWYRDYYGL